MKSKSLIKPPASKVLRAGRVILAKGEDVGEHSTTNCEELIIVIHGTATLLLDGLTAQVKQGDTYFINAGVKHNIVNKTADIVEYVYVLGQF